MTTITTTPRPDFAAEVKLAYDLIILRDLADLNGNHRIYRQAFVALYRVGRKAVYAAEEQLKAEARDMAAQQTSAGAA